MNIPTNHTAQRLADTIARIHRTGILHEDTYRKDKNSFSEADTTTKLVFPILQAAGWDIYDPRMVRQEKSKPFEDSQGSTSKRIDIMLLINRPPPEEPIPVFCIEVKKLGKRIEHKEHKDQSHLYAKLTDCEHYAITNGRCWHFFRRTPTLERDDTFRRLPAIRVPLLLPQAAPQLTVLQHPNLSLSTAEQLNTKSPFPVLDSILALMKESVSIQEQDGTYPEGYDPDLWRAPCGCTSKDPIRFPQHP